MRIIFLSEEIAPYSGSSVTSKVCGALTKALAGLGHDVTVVSPLYSSVDPDHYSLARRLSTVDIEQCGKKYACALYDGRAPSGVQLLFVGESELFGAVDSLSEDTETHRAAERIAAFGRVCDALLALPTMRADVAHAISWESASAFLHTSRRGSNDNDPNRKVQGQKVEGAAPWPAILTLPFPQRHGSFSPEDARFFLDGDDSAKGEKGFSVVASVLPALKHVITNTTKSARVFSMEAREFGGDLDVLDRRITGVLHGIDPHQWNPATDSALDARYDPFDLRGKSSCKAGYQHAVGLPVENVPLFSFIEWQEELAQVAHGEDVRGVLLAMRELLRNPVQVVVHASGRSPENLKTLEDLEKKWPNKFRFVKTGAGHDEESPRSCKDENLERHRLLAASDFIVVSGEPEWSSFVYMYAHRYGAVPIACESTEDEDVVINCDASLETGTGFVCRRFDADDLLATCRTALAAAENASFAKLRQRVMRLDWSWERSARVHEVIYKRAIEEAEEEKEALSVVSAGVEAATA